MKHPVKFILLILSLLPFFMRAQEVVVPTEQNKVIEEFSRTYPSGSSLNKKKSDTLILPFFDDFTTTKVYPGKKLWFDNYVYINNRFPKDPISFNAATFDGVNPYGKPYEPGQKNSRGNGADTLTSKYIDLSNYQESDSIFLSFFYQPQGNGDAPENYDSLILQFKPFAFWNGTRWDSNHWVTVWSAKGSFVKDFKMAMIHLPFKDSSNYYYNAFQFRFINYGNRSGNLDHWNVDYIYMDKNRSLSNKNFLDISVVYPPQGVLKRYRSMPYSHFISNVNKELRQTFTITARNNSENLRLVNAGYEIINMTNNQEVGETFSSGFADNIAPYYETNDFTQTNEFKYLQVSSKVVELLIKSAIAEPTDEFPQNDTFYQIQKFHKYFAYDDGTAEAGYGIENTDNGKVAYRFEINKFDSLRAIALYFNRSKDDVSQKRFNLVVWEDINLSGGSDGDDNVLYQLDEITPEYRGFLNGFTIYTLPKPIGINGIFYIGWEQNSEFMLNVGLDKNYTRLTGENIPNSNLFYKVKGSWKESEVKGALMIRPYFSKTPINPAGIQKKGSPTSVSLYPNPADEYFKINGIEGPYQISITNLHGKIIEKQLTSHTNKIGVSGLPKGLYLIRIESQEMPRPIVKKLLIRE